MAELQAMATTEMATGVIVELLASEPDPLDWEVGEAIAETILQEQHAAVWPWNMGRDRRTAKASLPGADLVGFVREEGGAVLLFGEVKTSGHGNAPPGVVYGRSGLIHQLEDLSSRRDLHWTLIRWLRARCTQPEHRQLYEAALQRFVQSNGTDFRLIGCLMRSTQPNENDLKARAKSLSAKILTPTSAKLIAWYLPGSTDTWPSWVEV